MILKTADFIDDMCEEFPDISRKSIESICDKGMKGVHRVMRDGMELFIKGVEHEEVKFFVPYTPERHEQLDTRNYYKKLKRKKTKDEQDSNNK